jgi:hypothetical protein
VRDGSLITVPMPLDGGQSLSFFGSSIGAFVLSSSHRPSRLRRPANEAVRHARRVVLRPAFFRLKAEATNTEGLSWHCGFHLQVSWLPLQVEECLRRSG